LSIFYDIDLTYIALEPEIKCQIFGRKNLIHITVSRLQTSNQGYGTRLPFLEQRKQKKNDKIATANALNPTP
jgi:hypothetical protein